MRLRSLRIIIGVTSVASIAGMIVSAILNHIGSVIAFGSIGAIGILVMISATTTVKANSQPNNGEIELLTGENLEDKVTKIISQYNVPEEEVRELLRHSVALARKNK